MGLGTLRKGSLPQHDTYSVVKSERLLIIVVNQYSRKLSVVFDMIIMLSCHLHLKPNTLFQQRFLIGCIVIETVK